MSRSPASSSTATQGWTSEHDPHHGPVGPGVARLRRTCACRTRRSSARRAAASRWRCGGSARAAICCPPVRSAPASGWSRWRMEHASNRVTFGEPIAERQAIQWMIADSAVEIEALRWLVLTAAWQVDQGLDSRQAQSMAKLYGGVKANEIVDRVLQMHGGMGYTRELPDRAVVPRAAAASDLRRHRRDPAPHDRAQPAVGPRVRTRSPRLRWPLSRCAGAPSTRRTRR